MRVFDTPEPSQGGLIHGKRITAEQLSNARGEATISVMKLPASLVKKVVEHVNRKSWWHVPPQDPDAYRKRGKFLASSFVEAEFWGRPLDEPQRAEISRPLIGDEATIEKILLGRRISTEQISMQRRWALDARLKRKAVSRGYDSIVIMSPRAFAGFKSTGKLPRSLELNTFNTD